MVVSAEQARQKAEARRQRILAKSADRMDVVSKGMASKQVEHTEPFPTTANNNNAARRRRYQNNNKKKDGGGGGGGDDNEGNDDAKQQSEGGNNDPLGKPPMDPSIKTTTTATTTSSTTVALNDTPSKDGDGKSIISSASSSTKSYYVNFLSSYEEMIRQQDYEYDVTTKHLRSVFHRVQYLGRGGGGNENVVDNNNKAPPPPQDGRDDHEVMLSYSQIRRCLLRMGITWNRSLPALIEDDVSITSSSVNSSSVISGGSGSAGKRDVITTDAQLIMLLSALVEAEERYRAEKLANNDNNYDDNDDSVERRGIHFSEFIQCYQLIVSGMQSLQILDVDQEVIKARIVDRVKERTFGLLRPFGPDTNLYKQEENKEEEEGAAAAAVAAAGDGLLPSSKRSGISAKGKSMMRDNNEKVGLDDFKSLIQSKCDTLARIVEDHETEMIALAQGMEALRSQHARTRKLMKLRRGLFIVGGTILCAALFTIIITREHQRKGEVAEGIAVLREAERKANAKTIAKLSEKRDVLGKKVDETEGTMRYLVNRNKGIDDSIKELEAEIERVDMKYWIDVTEIQRCVVQEEELGEALTEESAKKEEMTEELGWCQSRSRLMEKELNTLEHASTDQGAEEYDSGMTGDKVLHLGMKYNKLIRDAVTARQAYAAAAGLVASTMIHQLLPFVVKLFAPKPVQIIIAEAPPTWRRFLPWSRRNKRAELAVVEGLFGGSITYLLIRAIALFIFP